MERQLSVSSLPILDLPQKIRIRDNRGAGRLGLVGFSVFGFAGVAGLAVSGYLYRRSRASEPRRPAGSGFSLVGWIQIDVLVPAAAVALAGLLPFAAFLPDAEGEYVVEALRVNISEADFEVRHDLARGTHPKLYVKIWQNDSVVANTADWGPLTESHSAVFSRPFVLGWRRSDRIVWDVRDEDPLGFFKVLIRGGGADCDTFPLRGTYLTKGGSSIEFVARYLGSSTKDGRGPPNAGGSGR
jgi:hypothetical protein